MSLKNIKRTIGTASFGISMMATKVFAQTKPTNTVQTNTLQNSINNVSQGNTGTGTQSLQNYIATIINVLIGLIGTVAVIMLIIGGLRYVLSAGEEKNTKAAKDTILFAIIGIVVAILAFAIVNFVIGQLS